MSVPDPKNAVAASLVLPAGDQPPAEITPPGQTNTDEQARLFSGILEHTQANLTLLTPQYDADGRITDFRYVFTNPANARMTGRTVAEMMAHSLLSLFPNLPGTTYYDRLLHTATTGEISEFLFPYQADGIVGWFDISFVKQGRHVLFTSVDVTALKQAELEQQRQNEWLNTLIDSSLMAICYFDAVRSGTGQLIDFRITKLNPVHAQTLGGTVADISGRRVLDHYPGSVGNGFYERMVATVETGETQRFIMHYDVDGLDVWADIQMVRLDDGLLMSYLNISDIKNAQMQQQRQAERLAAANVELKRSNEHLQEFAYIASHDLQEPLRKIQSFSEILRTRHAAELSGPSLDVLTRMKNAAERMSELVADLLTYSRLHTHQEPFAEVSMAAVVEEVCDELTALIEQTGAEVTVGELPTVRGDAGQLQQLTQNLLSNALKYVAPGQSPVVQITSRRVPADILSQAMQIDISEGGTAPHTHYWEISVQDNGIGFNERYLDRLFKMFQRLHGRAQYQGSGIGLAICKRIVDNHAGGITARSVVGQGATFLVYLPA